MPHRNDFVEFRLAVLQNVYLLGYFSAVLILVFGFEVHVAVGVDVVEDGANFSETRQYLCHEYLRLAYIHLLDIVGSILFDFLIVDLSVFVEQLYLPGL